MNNLNNFLQVLSELNIPQDNFEDILEKNPGIIDGDYDEFVVNINLLYKAKVPKDVIGNLICTNANFLFFDTVDLKYKLHDLSSQGDLTELIQNDPDIFDK